MSTELTVVLCAPDRPLGEILTSIDEGLVDRAGLRHAGKILRCAWPPDSKTFDEATPEQALGPAERLSAHADGMAGWTGSGSSPSCTTRTDYQPESSARRALGLFLPSRSSSGAAGTMVWEP